MASGDTAAHGVSLPSSGVKGPPHLAGGHSGTVTPAGSPGGVTGMQTPGPSQSVSRTPPGRCCSEDTPPPAVLLLVLLLRDSPSPTLQSPHPPSRAQGWWDQPPPGTPGLQVGQGVFVPFVVRVWAAGRPKDRTNRKTWALRLLLPPGSVSRWQGPTHQVSPPPPLGAPPTCALEGRTRRCGGGQWDASLCSGSLRVQLWWPQRCRVAEGRALV